MAPKSLSNSIPKEISWIRTTQETFTKIFTSQLTEQVLAPIIENVKSNKAEAMLGYELID